MPKQEVLKLWQAIKGDLARARQLLPEAAISAAAAMQFQEFLDHNELGLACSALEDCGIDHSPGSKFWLALRDAAAKMGLSEHAEKYHRLADRRTPSYNSENARH
ncbi:MAG: hypothetical protein DMG94_05120 [Acidobacteria bacterium]|nr:MAG: hypothetical protein DMG94_05120 [Acidobacteriota bacterium]